jgi:hypothetical protein
MHVLARMNTNSAYGGCLNLNAKFHLRLFGCRSLQEFVRILDRVGMRETIAHYQPDFAIVRVSGYGLSVIEPPWTNGASLERNFHLVQCESDAGTHRTPKHFVPNPLERRLYFAQTLEVRTRPRVAFFTMLHARRQV